MHDLFAAAYAQLTAFGIIVGIFFVAPIGLYLGTSRLQRER